MDNQIKYVGSNEAHDEGLRHFYIVPCKPYTAFSGQIIDQLCVYTSSGANTKGLCTIETCIIPCFGTMTKQHRTRRKPLYGNEIFPFIRENAIIIIAAIIKTDSIKSSFLNYHMRNTPHYFETKEYFNRKIDRTQLTSYFGNNAGDWKDFEEKVGNYYFMETILKYKRAIINDVNSRRNTHMFEHKPNLLFLNNVIGKRNFYGVDLSLLPKYKDRLNENDEQDRYRISLFYNTSFDSAPEFLYLGGEINQLNIINSELDKYFSRLDSAKRANIYNSPVEFDIVSAIYESLGLMK